MGKLAKYPLKEIESSAATWYFAFELRSLGFLIFVGKVPMTILLDKHALWCGGGGIGCVMWGGGVVTNETSEEHSEI